MTSSHLLLQVSDVHLTLDGPTPWGAPSRENLVAGLALLSDSGFVADVIVVSGDLADTGDAACYDELAERLERFARGAAVVYLPGNHDDRETLSRRLLDAALSGRGPLNQVRWHGGLRIVALDSTVPGMAHGELDDVTLEFLRAELATPAPDGTLVALHHPPISSPVEPISRVRLRNPDAFGAALAGSDVRLVVCGHYHHVMLGSVGGVPVWVSPAVSDLTDVTSRDELRMIAGSGVSLIELRDGEHAVSVIPIRAPS
ncbi:MAG: metallophosphoesterase [Solirubrobacteraceae bacterium]